MNFLNDYDNKILKYLKNKNNFKDFYGKKDIFQRARIQLNSNRIFEENERKEMIKLDKKNQLNKSCSANLIKVPHITTFQRFQLLKEENANVIKRRSIYNNTNSLKPKKDDYLFTIKLIKKNRNIIQDYNSLFNNNESRFNKNESRNKKNKNHLIILHGNKIEYNNNNNNNKDNENIKNNNNESFYNISHSQSKRKLNTINLMKKFLQSTNFFSQKKIDLKKIKLNKTDRKHNKSCNKVNNSILKNFPLIQNINKLNI